LKPGRPRTALLLASTALAVGVADGLVFLGFEWVVKHGTDWLWNDVVDSDDVRWRVVPLALALSVALSALMRPLRQPRWTPPHTDPLGPAEGSAGEPPPAPALGGLATILLVGAAGLVAGASLGPEAPLVGLATGLGAWAAARVDLGAAGRVLVLASAGALLVAFFGSLIPIAIPLVIVYQRTGRMQVAAVLAIALAGLAAWGTVWLVHGDHHGYGSIPSDAVHARDYAAAAVLGMVAVAIGALLRWFVVRLALVTKRVEDRAPWWVAAAVFGLVLGALYLVGGQTVQFSGSEGSVMLLSGEVHYGAWALAGIALVKLAATAWSLTAGYRGGLVFPSVFAGVAVSLLVAGALPDLAGPGVLLGSVAGLLVEMTAPMLGVVMLLALLPAKLLPLGIAGAVGAIAGRLAVTRLQPADDARAR
jgi:H+/Cl- antiporter ClcA